MTWWSPAKCHTQTVVININSNGHGLYLSVLLKVFALCIKLFLHFKNCQVLWFILCK
jgi:hypothetical protein